MQLVYVLIMFETAAELNKSNIVSEVNFIQYKSKSIKFGFRNL